MLIGDTIVLHAGHHENGWHVILPLQQHLPCCSHSTTTFLLSCNLYGSGQAQRRRRSEYTTSCNVTCSAVICSYTYDPCFCDRILSKACEGVDLPIDVRSRLYVLVIRDSSNEVDGSFHL